MRMFIFLLLVNFVVFSAGSRPCPDNVKEQDIVDICLPLDPVIHSVITNKDTFCTAALSMWGCIYDNWSGCFQFKGEDFVPFIQIMQQVCMDYFDSYYNNITITNGGQCAGQDIAVNYQELTAKCPITHPGLHAIVNHTYICDNFRRVIDCAKQRFPLCPKLLKNSLKFYEAKSYGCKDINIQEVIDEIREKIDKLVEEIALKIYPLYGYGETTSPGGNGNSTPHGRNELNMQKLFDTMQSLKEIRTGLDKPVTELSSKIPQLDTSHSGNANQSRYGNVESPHKPDEDQTHSRFYYRNVRRRTVQTRSDARPEQVNDAIQLSIDLSIPIP